MRLTIAIIVAALAGLSMSGKVVEVSPGMMASALSKTEGSISELHLTGEADPRDFETIATLASDPSVKTLDMSGMSLREGYLQIPGADGRYHYGDGEMPAYLLFKATVMTLSLPANLKEIPEGFLSGSAVRVLTVPSTVERIGDYAFYNACMLNTLNGGEGLKEIGREAFRGCGFSRLDLSMAKSYGSYALAGMPEVWQIKLNPEAEYGEGVVADCPLLTNLTGYPMELPTLFAAFSEKVVPGNILKEVNGVGEFAFADVPAIWLVITESVTTLSEGAFANATTLTNVDVKQLGGRVLPVERSVFAGIDLSKVELYVDKDAEEVWREAPVWCEFDIKTGENSVDIPQVDEMVTIQPKNGYIEVEAPGWSGEVSLFSIGGVRLATFECEDRISIDTAIFADKILVVRVGDGLKTAVVAR